MITADTKAALKRMQAKTSLRKNPNAYVIGESYIHSVWEKSTIAEAKKLLTNGEIVEEYDWFQPNGDPAELDQWGFRMGDNLHRRKVLKMRNLGQIDTLVGVGMSGSLLVPRLADALGIDALVLRKPGVKTHATAVAEGRLGRRWVFVDDFFSSGETLRRAYGLVDEIVNYYDLPKAEFAGAYTYRNERKLHEPADLIDAYSVGKQKTNIMREIREGRYAE